MNFSPKRLTILKISDIKPKISSFEKTKFVLRTSFRVKVTND